MSSDSFSGFPGLSEEPSSSCKPFSSISWERDVSLLTTNTCSVLSGFPDRSHFLHFFFHLHDTSTLLLLCPMQQRYIGQTAPRTAFSCGEQVPDVAIPHYRDAPNFRPYTVWFGSLLDLRRSSINPVVSFRKSCCPTQSSEFVSSRRRIPMGSGTFHFLGRKASKAVLRDVDHLHQWTTNLLFCLPFWSPSSRKS